MKEEWKEIDSYKDIYEISNLGRVRRAAKSTKNGGGIPGQILKHVIVNGYRVVFLRKSGGIRKMKYIHRLIADAFLDNKECGDYINHINGDRSDCSLENLEWCTQSHNILHAYKTGQIKKNPKKLSKADVEKIRDSYKNKGVLQKDISKVYGVLSGMISAIITGRSWKDNS